MSVWGLLTVLAVGQRLLYPHDHLGKSVGSQKSMTAGRYPTTEISVCRVSPTFTAVSTACRASSADHMLSRGRPVAMGRCQNSTGNYMPPCAAFDSAYFCDTYSLADLLSYSGHLRCEGLMEEVSESALK